MMPPPRPDELKNPLTKAPLTGAIAELGYHDGLIVGERGLKHFNVFVFDSVDAVMVNADIVEEAPINCFPDERCIRYFAVEVLSNRRVRFRKESVERLVVLSSLNLT